MIFTRSAFYYGHTVTNLNNTLRINEGSGDVDIFLPEGTYSLTEYIEMVGLTINSELTQEYTLVLDRATRQVTLSAPLAFDLKVGDIYPENSGFPLLGFNGVVNLTGAITYTSDVGSGSEYLPQFRLQDFVDFDTNEDFTDGTVKESASGIVEVVAFSSKFYMECNVKFITDSEKEKGNPIEYNATGLQDAIDFMRYCIRKGNLEFIPDRDDRDSFTTVLLESTPSNKKGIGFKLKENLRAADHYETGKLKYRRID